MPPILQGLVALAIRVLFGLVLLRQMSLAVSDDLTHVGNVVLLVIVRVFRGVLVQYLNDLAATDRMSELPLYDREGYACPGKIVPFMPDSFVGTITFAPPRSL